MQCILTIIFFFNDTTTSETYTLSLHDALPIYLLQPGHALRARHPADRGGDGLVHGGRRLCAGDVGRDRSEEHTSELQSRGHLVCRLLLVKNNLSSTLPHQGRDQIVLWILVERD